MASDESMRDALARLARSSSDHAADDHGDSAALADERSFHEVIDRATAALDDLDAAARFVQNEGLDELEAAVERAERSVSARADDGREALLAFREYRRAAGGDHSHPGHGSSLGGADIARSK